jgi:hypothetical protein
MIIMVAERSVGEEEKRRRWCRWGRSLRGSHASLQISNMIKAAGIVSQLILKLAGEGGIGGMTPQRG